jgi:hypothetical protein
MDARNCGRLQRDTSTSAIPDLARYHHYELASAAFQIGIVLASAAVITGMMALIYIAGALGIAGLTFMGLGFFEPDYLHSLNLV